MARVWSAGSRGLVLLLACAPAPERVEARGEELVSSLEVEVGRDAVQLTLHVTNAGSEPVTLEYRTAQRYDFVVSTPEGTEVWRWSADRVFAQVLGTETLESGETVSHRASWTPLGRAGRYVAEGRLTASNVVVAQRTEFEVTGL